jgi:hypothetical protein
MVILYTSEITPRLQYIIDFISQELFDDPIRITSEQEVYLSSNGAKINYSPFELAANELLIEPVKLLFESNILPQKIECFEINYHTSFFESFGDMHFDVFAASFYLISRYEEYLPNEPDEFGRFDHRKAIAFRENFLHLPLVNIWLQEFSRQLQRKFPAVEFKRQRFKNILTYDIDIAYSYLHKGWLRNAGGLMRSILNINFSEAADRLHVLRGTRSDPFDCYEWLDALHLYCRIRPYYFFLVASQPSVYDKNIPRGAESFIELIEYYSGTYKLGVHPSWQSGDRHELLKEEKLWLESRIGREIIASRQHYVRLTLPETYRRLIGSGITKEFSMGYGSINGFRASVCSSFFWYDLQKEETTDMRVYPFCFMDANSFYEARQQPPEAYAELIRLYEQVKKVNGLFVSVWHNHLLGRSKQTEGWRQMFELFMKETVYWDAYV